MFQTSVIFSDKSVSESLILFMCEVVVCNYKFSVSSNSIVISACSSLSTTFLKS